MLLVNKTLHSKCIAHKNTAILPKIKWGGFALQKLLTVFQQIAHLLLCVRKLNESDDAWNKWALNFEVNLKRNCYKAQWLPSKSLITYTKANATIKKALNSRWYGEKLVITRQVKPVETVRASNEK